MQNRMELLSCLKSIARAKEEEAGLAAAGCAPTVRSGKERPLSAGSGPRLQLRAGPVRARSSPAFYRCCSARLPGAARPLHLHSEFKDVRQNPSQFS